MERLTHKARYQAGYKANIDVHVWECIDKLGQLEDLEEQGLLLKLPCKTGDTVYTVYSISEDRQLIYDFKLDALRLALNVIKGEFGKTIFLTKEEAEAALKELEVI